jgi:hypothetical protein
MIRFVALIEHRLGHADGRRDVSGSETAASITSIRDLDDHAHLVASAGPTVRGNGSAALFLRLRTTRRMAAAEVHA